MSDALPANIDIINFVFLLIDLRIRFVCLAVYTAVIFNLIFLLFNSLIILPVKRPFEFITGIFT